MRFLLIWLQTAPAGFDFPLVALLTGFIALPVKFLVDTVKGAIPAIPGPALPFVGVVLGFGFCCLVLVANRTAFDSAVLAQCGIAAVGGQVAAMAATWNQTRVDKVDEKIEKALNMPSTATKADVEAAVKKDASK